MIQFINNHRGTLVATIFLCIVTMLTLGLYSILQKDIIVKIDDEITAFKVTSSTVEELLYHKDIKVDTEDYISHQLSHPLENGMEIIIKRAIPVTIFNAGSRITINTSAETVQEVIEEVEIKVDHNDIVRPSITNAVNEDLEITVVNVEEKIEKINEEIPFKIIEKSSNNLFKGDSRKIQNGENGLKEIEIQKRFENGELVSEITLRSAIIKEPIDEIIEKGTKELLASPKGMITYDKAIEMVATAYDLSFESTGKNPGDKNFGITASGTKARPGVVAVDPKVIPLGTKLYIESLDGWPDYGFAVAEDTGGAIKGNKIDLFMQSHSTATRFGRRRVKVYILD